MDPNQLPETEAHPDRVARTLAQRARPVSRPDRPGAGPGFADPDPARRGDARADLHLLWHAVDRALAGDGCEAARNWLAGLDTPDLRRGTIQDGTARGLRARLEETLSLCPPPAPDPEPDPEADQITGKDLRRRREILVASGGVRVRFSRKQGILLIDRRRDLNLAHFVQFDDQGDAGCLDRFEPRPGERARIFSPAFLSPERLAQGRVEDRLVLRGRLGRGPAGFDCRLTLVGRKDEDGIRMQVSIDNQLRDHRLRVRFVGAPDDGYVSHRGTPAFHMVHAGSGRFLAATLVRACGRLRVGDAEVATPDAQMRGVIEHVFGLGMEV